MSEPVVQRQAVPDPQEAQGAPLITGKHLNTSLPPTWCVVECMQGCRESWTIDSADFVRRLTVDDAERLVTPFLLDHEVTQHGRGNANA